MKRNTAIEVGCARCREDDLNLGVRAPCFPAKRPAYPWVLAIAIVAPAQPLPRRSRTMYRRRAGQLGAETLRSLENLAPKPKGRAKPKQGKIMNPYVGIVPSLSGTRLFGSTASKLI